MRRGGKGGGLIFFSAESIDRNMAESGTFLSNECKFRISGDVIRILVIVEFRENCTY